MTTTIDQSYASGYSSLIHDLSQQMGSKLMDKVRLETREFEVDYFDRLGPGDDTEKLVRNQDSPSHEQAHSRRQVAYREFQFYPTLDRADDQKMLIDPKSKYVQQGLSVYGRRMDKVIVDAAYGTAKAGKAGGTSVTFPSAQQITTAGGLTKAKLIDARELFGINDADEGPDGDELYLACTQYQISDILNDTTLTSAEYNDAKLLMTGQINKLLGFTWVKMSTGILPVNGSSKRRVLCWQRNGLLLSRGDYDSEIVKRSDKSKMWQLQNDYALGAVRMEEERVVEIECSE